MFIFSCMMLLLCKYLLQVQFAKVHFIVESREYLLEQKIIDMATEHTQFLVIMIIIVDNKRRQKVIVMNFN